MNTSLLITINNGFNRISIYTIMNNPYLITINHYNDPYI